jgi:phosphoadenosine phosphosulfate reductase
MADNINSEKKEKLKTLEKDLDQIVAKHSQWVLTSSLSLEDMLIFHVLNEQGFVKKNPLAVVTLDTGMLPEETLLFIQKVEDRYGVHIQRIQPDKADVEAYVNEQGVHAFYESLELRHLCCSIRKTRPLEKALRGKDAWITGQRRQQSITRTSLSDYEYDDKKKRHKYNPLCFWSYEEVFSITQLLEIPYHPFYDQGYQSIGCGPCTRAVLAGESERSGRWWWELEEQKECGIHWANGQLTRTKKEEKETVERKNEYPPKQTEDIK